MTSSDYLPDAEAVGAYLDKHVPGLRYGPLQLSLIAGGKSNLTYLVSDGSHEWVLRRPPLGHVLATAHDMSREFRAMSALGGTGVPVPTTLLYCSDDTVLGSPWYLMSKAPGTAYSSAARLAPLGPEFAAAAAHSVVRTLVQLHAVDYNEVGLGSFGHPDGYLERQLTRWRKQLDASRSREIDGIDELHGRLVADIPVSQAPTILHGDYRLGNVLLDDAAAVTAILDWEMSTIGDPLADLGLLIMYSTVDTLVDGGGDVTDTGFLSANDLISIYAEESGRDVWQLPWYVAFSYYKLAVIIEGIHYRHTQGKTVGEGFDVLGGYVAPLVAAGTYALRGI